MLRTIKQLILTCGFFLMALQGHAKTFQFRCEGRSHDDHLRTSGSYDTVTEIINLRVSNDETHPRGSTYIVASGTAQYFDKKLSFDNIGEDSGVSGLINFDLEDPMRSRIYARYLPAISQTCKKVEPVTIECRGRHYMCRVDGILRCCYEGAH